MSEAGIIGLFAIFVAFLVGFKEQILSFWYRPRLQISISNAPPDCHKTAFLFGDLSHQDCYYYRLKVENTGRSAAKDVEVMVSKLSTKSENGDFVINKEFLPQNLMWSFIRKPIFGAISPKMPKHCDFGHIMKSPPGTKKALFEIDVCFQPMNRCHVLGSDTYRVKIIIAAANVKPITKTFEIAHSGQWFDDEKDMFERGTNIRTI
jgi:hypothetical protein